MCLCEKENGTMRDRVWVEIEYLKPNDDDDKRMTALSEGIVDYK